MPETAKPLVAAVLAREAGRASLLLAPTPQRAQALFEEAQLYGDGLPVARLPEREQLPYEFTRGDQITELERARALGLLGGEGPALVVASWLAAAEHVAPPSGFAEHLELMPGAQLDPATLVARLEAMGYAIGPLADAPGVAARRGGIVDIAPADGSQPVRVEFFGPEVDSVRTLDIGNQRSSGRLTLAAIPPAGPATAAARDAARELLPGLSAGGEGAEAVIEQLQLVAQGYRSALGAALGPLLANGTALDHLPEDGQLIIDEAAEGFEALSSANEHERRAQAEQEARGAIPAGLPPISATAAQLRDALLMRSDAVELQRFGSGEYGARRLPLAATPGFGGKLKVLTQQARAWAREGKAVVIASQQALRIGELMEEDSIAATPVRMLSRPPAPGTVVVAPLAVAGGFMLDDRLILVSDTEVFGFRKRRRPVRTRLAIREDLVAALEPGDYLVHADHGIARFGGLVRKALDGVEKEYLDLQYAEGDRIYVPVDQLESVSRYVGPADRPPALTRLGSQEWSRAKRRVRQAIAEIAQDLLELYARREVARGFAFPPDSPWQAEMEAAFPFVETPDQLQAVSDVKADMERPRPMDRLIAGDVGYGKTEVAIRAAFKAVNSGKQVAVLVPTTVLAEQHGSTFRERMAGFPVRVEVLSRFRSAQEQADIVARIATGDVDVAVGTHRLLQRDIQFRDLGLVIVDEEQRFGVSHKERLKEMRSEVDVLSMSATPIPRTLQMSLAGIRDMSTVMTPPEERLPIRTYVTEWDGEILREAIEREMGRGGQVYFVHNRVHNIERVVARLRDIVPDADITVAHGQMPEEQLERAMMEFAAGGHDILVCTTIIESGVDIPNVNTIIINDANTLGLSQLYQLRGRVGRGANRAYAYLLYDRSRAISEAAQKRLEAIFEATDLGAGFQIALRDLEIRGAGNLLGAEQSGHIASVGFDMYSKLLAEAVTAIKRATLPEEEAGPPALAPTPSVDLPLSAHVPVAYIDDMNARLATYQRIAAIETADEVAEMQAEMRDRFGAIPASVENLLYIQLVRALGRRAHAESVKTDHHMFHIRIRGGIRDDQRARVEALGLRSVLVGPNQVRVDRVTAGEGWMPLLVRILRALGGPAGAAAT